MAAEAHRDLGSIAEGLTEQVLADMKILGIVARQGAVQGDRAIGPLECGLAITSKNKQLVYIRIFVCQFSRDVHIPRMVGGQLLEDGDGPFERGLSLRQLALRVESVSQACEVEGKPQLMLGHF